jgi:hypothetical protein
MQMSASTGGECALHFALEKTNCSVTGRFGSGTATIEASAAMFCCSELDLAGGCAAGPVRCCVVSQQS